MLMGDCLIAAQSDCHLTFNRCHRDGEAMSLCSYSKADALLAVLTEDGVSYNRSFPCLGVGIGMFVSVSVLKENGY